MINSRPYRLIIRLGERSGGSGGEVMGWRSGERVMAGRNKIRFVRRPCCITDRRGIKPHRKYKKSE